MCDRCEELEERVERLEAIVEHFEVRAESNPDLTDLWFADSPIGHAINNANDRSKKVQKKLANINTADDGVGTPEDLASLLEVHQDFIDLRDGRREKFQQNGSSKQIAAVMFGLFARYELEDNPGHTGVKHDKSKLSMKTARAKSALRQAERDYDISLLPADGHTTAVKRAMWMAVRGSHPGECDDPATCSDGLFEYTKNDQHTLRVNREEFLQYMRSWQENRDRGVRGGAANSVVTQNGDRSLPPAQTDGGETYTD